MALLLETTLGDLVIDLDIDGSPALCKNVLKLAKARYYTGNLVYNVQPNRFCQFGDPCGDGSGGACIYGVLDAHEEFRKQKDEKHPNVLTSQRRFLKSDNGRALNEDECRLKGRVVATEMNGIADTIGSQLLITINEGPDYALDGFRNTGNGSSNIIDGAKQLTGDGLAPQKFRSVGRVVEDDNGILESLNKAYCDSNGRPYADVRVIRTLLIEDPFDDPEGMDQLLKDRGVILAPDGVIRSTGGNSESATSESIPRRRVTDSPDYERPPEEKVETRISAADIDEENNNEGDMKKMRLLEEDRLKKEDKSRAVVLEMLGDLPSADITAPENVLFVCKLNPVTEDDDLELIFSRFDEMVTVDIVRDHKTGASLQYAFVEFTTKDQAAEAYFKMNNALVDDRRIKVDFSQSVSKVWDRFNQRGRKQSSGNYSMPKDPFREQQLTSSHQNYSHRDKVRNKDFSSDRRRRRNDDKISNHPPHYNDRDNSRKKLHHDSSRRDHERYRGANDRKRLPDSYDDDRRHSHRDRYPRDRRDYDFNQERRHHRGSDRDGLYFRNRINGGDGCEYSRSRDEPRHRTERRRDEPSTRRSEKKPEYDGGFEDDSVSERSETGSRKRGRRRNDDRRRRSHTRSRSRSSGRSESGSYTERRQRHRSERKKDKKKCDRKREDDKRHHKRSKRDSKHYHHRKDRHEEKGREQHRDS